MELMRILETKDILQNILILGSVTLLGIVTYSYFKGIHDIVKGERDYNKDNEFDDSQIGSHSECGSESTIKNESNNENIVYQDVKYKDVEILHQILNSNPEVGSRYSSMILQDIINNNIREVADLGEHLIKRIVKYSLPLAGLILTLVGIHIIEPNRLLVLI